MIVYIIFAIYVIIKLKSSIINKLNALNAKA